MKAILRNGESAGCVAQSHPTGKYELEIKNNVEYDFIYDDNENFYLIVDDRLYGETSTAFDFVEESSNEEVIQLLKAFEIVKADPELTTEFRKDFGTDFDMMEIFIKANQIKGKAKNLLLKLSGLK